MSYYLSYRDISMADSILSRMFSQFRKVYGREEDARELNAAWTYMWRAFNEQTREIGRLEEENKKLKAELKATRESDSPATPSAEEKKEKKMPPPVYKKKEGVEIVALGRSPAGVWVGKLDFGDE